MEKNKKIDFSIGIFDDVSDSIKEKIKNAANNCELYVVGVYTDEFVINEYKTYPINKIDQRMKIAKSIEGVDFVFEVKNKNSEELKKTIEQAYTEFMKNK